MHCIYMQGAAVLPLAGQPHRFACEWSLIYQPLSPIRTQPMRVPSVLIHVLRARIVASRGAAIRAGGLV